MELVITSGNLKSIPQQKEGIITESLGFLNSEYKSVVKESLKNSFTKSIFGIRKAVKNRRYQLSSGIEVALKVTTFFVIIMVVFLKLYYATVTFLLKTLPIF